MLLQSRETRTTARRTVRPPPPPPPPKKKSAKKGETRDAPHPTLLVCSPLFARCSSRRYPILQTFPRYLNRLEQACDGVAGVGWGCMKYYNYQTVQTLLFLYRSAIIGGLAPFLGQVNERKRMTQRIASFWTLPPARSINLPTPENSVRTSP